MREPLDIRLDFISKFTDMELACKAMTELRHEYIKIDNYLKALASSLEDAAFQRTVALARTNNEQACQHTIKALCLLWEDKSVPDAQAV